MHYLQLIIYVTLIHLLAAIIPGPDFLMVTRNSLTYSRRIGMWTAVGFGAGILVHILYSIAGLALIISKSILLFNTIKLLGAGYLIYIGFKSFFSKSENIKLNKIEQHEAISPLKAVQIGFLTNILNPKATLFFLSLFTLIISPNTPAYILATVSVIMVANTILWFMTVAVFLTQRRIQLIYEKFQNYLNKFFGLLLVTIGIKVAFSKR